MGKELQVSQEAEAAGAPAESWVPAPALALVAPDLGMERVARSGRVAAPLLLALVCSLALGGAEAYRADARQATLSELESQNKLKELSDQAIADQTRSAERAFAVKRIALAAVKPPAIWAGSLLGLYVLVWFLRARSTGPAMQAVAAAALLPHAAADALGAGAAWLASRLPLDHGPLVPRTLADLLALAGVQLPFAASRLAGALDLFSLWAALLLGFGFAAATRQPRGRAVSAVLFSWLLFRLLTRVSPLGG
jgi:hypothetical protein